MSPSKALRLAVEKAADEELDLVLAVIEAKRAVIGHAQLIDEINENHLIVMLDGPDGMRGAMCLDIQIIAALIEAQTMGKVFPRDADVRKITQTDAAISVPLIDGILARFEANLTEEDDHYWSGGYAFGVRMEDSRALGLVLDEPDYNIFRVTIDVDRGARKGHALLALPVREKPRVTVGVQSADPAGDGQVSLEGRLMGARARLNAVLCRISMPLSEVSGLKPGDTLPISPDALRETLVEAVPKRKVAVARLGQMNGNRALCLSGDGLPARKEHIEEGGEAGLPELAAMDGALDMGGMDAGTMGAEPMGMAAMDMDLPSNDVDPLPDLEMAPMGMDMGGDDLPDLSDLDIGGDLDAMGTGDFGATPMDDLPDLDGGDLPPLPMSSGLD